MEVYNRVTLYQAGLTPLQDDPIHEDTIIGVFFCPATWSASSKSFPRTLGQTSRSLKARFTIIVVPCDISSQDYAEVLKSNPHWVGVSLEDAGEFKAHFNNPSVPSLILCTHDFTVINPSGMEAVMYDGPDKFPWDEYARCDELSSQHMGVINNSKVAVLLLSSKNEAVLTTMHRVAVHLEGVRCLYARPGNDLGDKIRSRYSIDTTDTLVYLDLPSNSVYIESPDQFTEQTIELFLTKAMRGQLVHIPRSGIASPATHGVSVLSSNTLLDTIAASDDLLVLAYAPWDPTAVKLRQCVHKVAAILDMYTPKVILSFGELDVDYNELHPGVFSSSIPGIVMYHGVDKQQVFAGRVTVLGVLQFIRESMGVEHLQVEKAAMLERMLDEDHSGAGRHPSRRRRAVRPSRQ